MELPPKAVDQSPQLPQSLNVKAIEPASLMPGQTAETQLYITYLPLLLLVLFAGFVLLFRRPEVIVKDHPNFSKSLRIWHDLVSSQNSTPRSIKRFVNKVRFFAMRQSQVKETEDNRYVKKLKKWLGLAEPVDEEREVLSESMLVALSAIHHAKPEWLKDDKHLIAATSQVIKEMDEKELEGTIKGEGEKILIINTLNKYRTEFGNWPPTKEQMKLFMKLSEGINVH